MEGVGRVRTAAMKKEGMPWSFRLTMAAAETVVEVLKAWP